ncbi:response regulator transcription factor [Curvibacter sp. RS43]|uniref:response regulator transcription factor n=1 Tax=Curvibacter microcysteis TaxID=3026419 RepID=UPI00236148B5|nr:response regulator transcription factor [Curvibacter sp. RS43]MDD0809618.1 response regulator transcription factor [Curvibacter sp. RS43]
MKLLLIEDDRSMQSALQRALSRRQIEVSLCEDGLQALSLWQERQPDVVVLDLSLPGLDGLHVLDRARRAGLRTPVLILTARGTVGDRVIGLNSGADDYLAKPFDLDELEARLRALHRRHQPALTAPAEARQPLGDLEYDKDNGAFYLRGEVLDLSPRELTLLQALISRPGHAVSKERLFALVFPDDDTVQLEAIEVVVYRLRKKLSQAQVSLMTLRGLGYLLKAES